MKMINEVKSILTMERVTVDKLSFERFDDKVKNIDENGQITFDRSINKVEESTFRVHLGVLIAAEKKYEIIVQISGLFRINNDSALGKKILENNTVAILFPYLRSQLTLLTSQPDFEPIVLPVMNINALFKNSK